MRWPPGIGGSGGPLRPAYRSLGVPGSLHDAHVTKSGEGADLKPFGSVFWHNFARATWNIKRSSALGDSVVNLALHHRKANLGPLLPSMGFSLDFAGEGTSVRRIDPARVPDLAPGLTLPQRLYSLLKSGPKARSEIQAEMEDTGAEVLRKTIDREVKRGRFVKLEDGRVALPSDRTPTVTV